MLAAAQPEQARAWRELALRWNVSVGEGEPCAAVQQAGLACWRSAGGGLPAVRQLARPGLLTLRQPNGREVYALLVGLDSQRATLQAGAQRFDIGLAALAGIWRGDYATLWRTPPGWRPDGGAPNSTLRAWMAGISRTSPAASKSTAPA